ncbi:hypothetical protein KHC17_10455 [Agrobacterium salinitolerans]|uniref:hypothetical protein n=1 Tax=Agrobacterium salinitolerans TaxID=1183413 RepID=UPI001C21AEE3|nr:hypothetical protein [Agrobacterium salinitolerans]QXC50948.1 hypothetical protein KHC17_10455 [Agrobacterium salinitolerans]
MADLDRNTIKKLRKLLPMLASDHAGEVTATVAAIMRTLESAGACLHDLVALIDKPPRIVEKVAYQDRKAAPSTEPARSAVSAAYIIETGRVLLNTAFLQDRERTFVDNMVVRAELAGDQFTITVKQHIWFRELETRHREMEAARV